MAPQSLKWRLLSALVLLVLSGGCGAPAQPALIAHTAQATAMPAPVVRVDSLPTAAPAVVDEAVQDQLEPFSEAPEDLARAAYGERLIDWIGIDAIEVLAPVTSVGWSSAGSPDNPDAVEWDSPGAKVGWVIDSALPGDESGNIILYGHNNINSSVFRSLADLQAGAVITLTSAQRQWLYEVSAVHILPVNGSDGERADYAQHLLPGMVPRLTLISCWPPDNNTHRVIVVAYEKPLGSVQ